MPKITIDLPKDTNEQLKKLAKDDYRSLTNYITVHLINFASHPTSYIDTTTLPEGTTIKTKTARALTPEEEKEQRYNKFQKLAKQIIGKEIPIGDYRMLDHESDNIYYDKALEEPLQEGSSIKCVYIYNLPEAKQREYLEELKHYYEKEEEEY